MQLITNKTKLNQTIKSIATRGKKLDVDVHTAACSCILHAQDHGDTTLATNLILAMPKSGRTKTLREWFSKYSPLHWSSKENCFRVNKGKSAQPFNVEGAIDDPFWNEKEKTQADFSIDKLIALVERKVKKAANDGDLKEGDMDLFHTKMAALQA